MANVKHLHEGQGGLAWLAAGLRAALLNNAEGEGVMVTISRIDAIELVRMIEERQGDADRTG